jgi:hypothetical protein
MADARSKTGRGRPLRWFPPGFAILIAAALTEDAVDAPLLASAAFNLAAVKAQVDKAMRQHEGR